MKSIGITIRKKNKLENGIIQSPTKKNINKQILTLHKKLKKEDKVITHYGIEKDESKRNYHTHLLIQYNDEKNIYNTLNRFIGGSKWCKEYDGLDVIKVNNGGWGEIRLHEIYNEIGFQGYINKIELSKTLY